MWGHEKLDAYRKTLLAAAALDRVAQALPPGRYDLREQLTRAAASVLLNLAEGASEFSAPEKARFYRISRRSGAECAAILDLVELVVARPPPLEEARRALNDVGALLTRLIRAQQNGKPSASPSAVAPDVSGP